MVLFILLAIISLGFYVNAVVTLDQATSQGVRAMALGDTLGCPGDSAQTQLQSGQSATVYGVVDDTINADRPFLSTAGLTGPLPVVTWAAFIGNQTNPQQNNAELTVAYAYHPVIPLPGVLPSTVWITDTVQMMVQTPPPSNAVTTSPL
ncbi:hypothetical protein, partial [Methylacidiphilum caldifontis]|uniref:hypothetical protein n=1 Tax=Methylacidiphilum caldifontis TaxID=2795386 RepID=UPI001FC9608B